MESYSWETCLAVCGSNAFGQLHNNDSLELMRPIFDRILFSNTTLEDQNKINKKAQVSSSGKRKDVKLVTCGSNSSMCVFSGREHECFLWGEGFGGTSLKMITSFQLGTKEIIMQLSCGQDHAGMVTDSGKVFTWGSGENGKLGHGGKQNCTTPRQIASLQCMKAIKISCGGFHTAIIAAPTEIICNISIRAVPDEERYGDGIDGQIGDENLLCGYLFTCGLNKAGQLGLGEMNPSMSRFASKSQSVIATPTLVKYFEREGCLIADVSCGFHHTTVIAVPNNAVGNNTRGNVCIETKLFSFGYGEHGRLGLGDEEDRHYPSLVKFPVLFTPAQVSAGKQHSLVRGVSGCFAWGSNDMGQLGVANPNSLEFAVEPMRILIPDSMFITSIIAGSRHSSAVTNCGKLLTWGWGEEGQLGHGSEKNSYMPRPCRLPRIGGVIGTPMAAALGNTHTIVVLKNPTYISEITQEQNVSVETKVVTIEADAVTSDKLERSSPVEEQMETDESVEDINVSTVDFVDLEYDEPMEIRKKYAIIIDNDEIIETDSSRERSILHDVDNNSIPNRVCGVRDLLIIREERRLELVSPNIILPNLQL